jgi:hypothetical protein
LRKFTVSTETLKKTTKCSHDFSCLTTGKCGNLLLCKVEKRFDNNMLYVKTTRDTEGVSCPYKFNVGSSVEHICLCPTHYAIYEETNAIGRDE